MALKVKEVERSDLWKMASVIMEKQKQAFGLNSNDVDWQMLEENWFEWLCENLLVNPKEV